MEKSNDEKAWNGELIGKTATPKFTGDKSYIVTDVYFDSNGCTRTGDNGWNSSFIDETSYV